MDLEAEKEPKREGSFILYHWDKFRFRLKRHFVEVLKTKNSDKAVAQGYALGTFISILPTPGFGPLLALAMLAIFKRINKIAVFVAMAIWNVWTAMPFYWLSMKIGNTIYTDDPIQLFELDFVNEALHYSRRFLIGNLIVTIPFSILSYYFALWVIKKVRFDRNSKKEIRSKKPSA